MWELEYNGIRKSLADWGLNGLSVEKVSSAADTIRFTAAAEFDSAQQFAYDAKVTLWRAGVRHFTGRIATPPRSGTPYGESLSYTAKGAWNELNRYVYEQFWRGYDDDLTPTTVILGKSQANTRITCGAQIREILDFAIKQGASLGYVAADLSALDITPPESGATDITTAAAILNMLNWHKDFTTWFDYSGVTPILRFSKRSTAGAGSIDVKQGAPNEEIFITRREDLKLRGVVINYSTTNTVSGKTYFGLHTDKAGATSGLDVLKSTISLEGYSVDELTQEIKSTSVPTIPIAIENYLRSRVSWLYSSKIKSITWSDQKVEHTGGELITDPETGDVSEAPPVVLPYILKSGSCQDWMKKKTGACSISAQAIINYNDGRPEKKILISVNETTTDASSNTYKKTENFVPGESIPSGLASKIYNQFQEVQFEGTFTLLEEEVSGTWHPGKVLNLTGSLAEWVGMRAQIQQVQENVDEGRTIITFGPAEHLSPQDFVELLRVNRIRKKTDNSEVRATGEISGRLSIVNLSGRGPNTDTTLLDEGGGMPPIGEDDKEFMLMQIRLVTPEPTEEEPDPQPVPTAMWDWGRLVAAEEF